MALTEENGGNGMVMPVMPMYGGGNGGNNNGGLFGNGDSWLGILFLIALLNGGWGGFGGFGGGMMGGLNGMMLGYDFPWLFAGQQNINTNTNNGFRDAMINDNITSVRDGIANLSTQLCGCCGDMQMSLANGFANTNLGIANGTAAIQNSLCNGFNGVNTAINGAQNAVSQQLYTNELASLNRSFAEQTANTQGFNSVQSQLAQCCCDNRLATESLRATVLSENCADRYEAANNTRNIIDSQNRGIQLILDKLCDQELQAERRENANLRTQLNMASLAASQTAQTAQIRDGQIAATTALVNELRSCPIPSQPVYGSQPIFTCPNNNNNGCGCGCGGNNF